MTTPTELITQIRQRNNIVGDNFFQDSEILDWIFKAHTDLAVEARVIERTFTTTTVASTQEYAMPSRMFSVRRVEFDGKRLDKIDFTEDDAITGFDADTTNTGTPLYWFEWNYSVFLRPIPSSALTLKILGYNRPQTLTTTSTFEVSDRYDDGVIDFCSSKIAEKEQNFPRAQYFAAKWAAFLQKAAADKRIEKRGSAFAYVKDESTVNSRLLEV